MNLKLILLFVLAAPLSFGQTYTFSHLNQTYADLTGSTSLNNGVAWDDPDFTVPIGFNFEYFEETINTINITSDGLGGLLKVGDCNGTSTSESLLFAYGADIIDRGYDGMASLSNVSYKTEGLIPNRICKIEWNNVGFYSGLTDANGNKIDYLNFQLWLYESTNVIEIHFGPKSITQPTIDFEGETGTFISLVDNVSCASQTINGHQMLLGGSPSNPDFYDNVYSLEDTIVYLDGVIPANKVYRFTPASTASQEELNSIDGFSIVPNPADENFHLVLGEGLVDQVNNISILDINGKVLYSNLSPLEEISVSDLNPGIYFVRIETSSGSVFSEKLLKQ